MILPVLLLGFEISLIEGFKFCNSPVLRFFIEPTPRVLSPDWIDAPLSQSALDPREHNPLHDALSVVEDQGVHADHVLELVIGQE